MSLSVLNAYGKRKLTQRTYTSSHFPLTFQQAFVPLVTVNPEMFHQDYWYSGRYTPINLNVFLILHVWCMMALKKCRNI